MKKLLIGILSLVFAGTLISCTGSEKSSSISQIASENSSERIVTKYTIHYDLGELPDAVIETLSQEVIAGEYFELAIPEAEGYIFEKWTDQNKKEILSGIYTFESDLYLTAVWQKDESENGWSERI